MTMTMMRSNTCKEKMMRCNEMRGVNYRQMVSKAAHKDLIPVRRNDVR